MHEIDFIVERVTRENYHMFDDIVRWRMTGVELTAGEKEANRGRRFDEAYKELEHSGFYSYAAVCDGRFVGWISMMYTPKIGPRWKKGMIYVDELWTAPEFRRKGVATQLMQKAFECQKEMGAVEARLYVGANNVAAQELYKRCGMRPTGTALFMRSDRSQFERAADETHGIGMEETSAELHWLDGMND